LIGGVGAITDGVTEIAIAMSHFGKSVNRRRKQKAESKARAKEQALASSRASTDVDEADQYLAHFYEDLVEYGNLTSTITNTTTSPQCKLPHLWSIFKRDPLQNSQSQAPGDDSAPQFKVLKTKRTPTFHSALYKEAELDDNETLTHGIAVDAATAAKIIIRASLRSKCFVLSCSCIGAHYLTISLK
jgi:hypothetical protein